MSQRIFLSGTWGHVGIMEPSKAYYFRVFFMYMPVIYWGSKFMKEMKLGYFMYNILVIGAICNPLFILVEIFNRIVAILTFFFCIVGGIFYWNVFIRERKKKIKKIIFFFSIISIVFAIYPYFSDMLTRPTEWMLFIWDANGREFLPYW